MLGILYRRCHVPLIAQALALEWPSIVNRSVSFGETLERSSHHDRGYFWNTDLPRALSDVVNPNPLSGNGVLPQKPS